MYRVVRLLHYTSYLKISVSHRVPRLPLIQSFLSVVVRTQSCFELCEASTPFSVGCLMTKLIGMLVQACVEYAICSDPDSAGVPPSCPS